MGLSFFAGRGGAGSVVCSFTADPDAVADGAAAGAGRLPVLFWSAGWRKAAGALADGARSRLWLGLRSEKWVCARSTSRDGAEAEGCSRLSTVERETLGASCFRENGLARPCGPDDVDAATTCSVSFPFPFSFPVAGTAGSERFCTMLNMLYMLVIARMRFRAWSVGATSPGCLRLG